MRGNLNQYISIGDNSLITKNGKKYLAIKLRNQRDLPVSGVTIFVKQFDERMTFLTDSMMSSITIENGTGDFIWVPKQELDPDCASCEVSLVSVNYGRYIYKQHDENIDISYLVDDGVTGMDFTDINKGVAKKSRTVSAITSRRSMLACIISVCLVVVALAFMVLQINSFITTAPGFRYDGIEYVFTDENSHDDNTPIQVTGYAGSYDKIVIPETINSHPVVGIMQGAFSEAVSVTEILIEANIAIEKEAFAGNTSLVSVTMNNVTEVGDGAFEGCENLVYVSMDKVTSIGKRAFANCGIRSLELLAPKADDAVAARAALEPISIGSEAFAGCKKLSSVVITREINLAATSRDFLTGSNVETLTIASLHGAIVNLLGEGTPLKELSVGAMENIPESFCEGFAHLEKVTIGALNTPTVGQNAFNGCNALANLVVGNNIQFTEIGTKAFADTAIFSFDATKLATIPDDAFNNCQKLARVTLGEELTSVGNRAFKNCTVLKAVDVPAMLTSVGDEAFASTAISTFTIGEALTSVGERAFAATALTEVAIPQTLTSIGKGAYADCTKLEAFSFYEIKTPNGKFVEYFGDEGKDVPASLARVTLNTSMDIYDEMFMDCAHIIRINLPETVTSIGTNAFANCKSLDQILLPATVEVIGSGAFKGCTNIAEFDIPDLVTTIADSTFEGCSRLANTIDIPHSVTSIGKNAFRGCSLISGIGIPGSIKSIGDGAFADCIKLVGLTIPNSVETIGDDILKGSNAVAVLSVPFIPKSVAAFFGSAVPSALKELAITSAAVSTIAPGSFEDCIYIQKISLPYGITEIGASAFDGCTSLASLVLPETLTSIGAHAFYYCSSLQKLVIPTSVTNIGEFIFCGNLALADLTVPFIGKTGGHGNFEEMYNGDTSGLKRITVTNCTKLENGAFQGCSGLESITLPSNLEVIGDYAFQNCSSLKKIEIPRGVKTVGRYIFTGAVNIEDLTVPFIGANCDAQCKGLLSEYFDGRSTNFYTRQLHKLTVTNCTSISANALNGACTNLITLDLPDNLASIGENAFLNCSGLETINIRSVVETIGKSAFHGCESLKSLDLSASIAKALPNEAFNSCRALVELKLPATLESVGASAFANCSSLKSLSIPQTAKTIGDRILLGCVSLESLTIPSISGAFCNLFGVSSGTAIPQSLTSVTLTDCQSIPRNAFSGCRNIETIVLPNGLETISNQAFQNCASLTAISIPNTVQTLGASAFSGCLNLQSVKMPIIAGTSFAAVFGGNSGVRKLELTSGSAIGANEYSGAMALEELTLPTTLTSIGPRAFQGCAQLKEVDMSATAVASIESYAFDGCERISKVLFSSTLTSIGEHAFARCASIAKLQLPQSLVEIGEAAFSDCHKLGEVRVPSSMVDGSIQTDAFANCYRLYSVYYTTPKDGGAPLMIKGTNYRGALINGQLTRYAIKVMIDNSGDSLQEVFTDDFRFVYDDDDAIWYIIEYSGNNTQLVLPESFVYNHYDDETGEEISDEITSYGILQRVFFNNDVMTEVTLPASVAKIGIDAFNGCSKLKTVNAADCSVTELPSGVFSNCTALKRIVLPTALQQISENAFAHCTKLVTIELPATLATVSDTAFAECNRLYDVLNLSSCDLSAAIPAINVNVTTSADAHSAKFQEIDGFQFVHDASGKLNGTIGWVMVDYSGDLTTIALDSMGEISAYRLDDGAFSDVDLVSISIKEAVSDIGKAFAGKSNLVSVDLSASTLTELAAESFKKCGSLTEIRLPHSLTAIGSKAFENDNALEAVHLDDLSTWCSVNFADAYANPLYLAHSLYVGGNKVSSLEVPSGISTIASFVFAGGNFNEIVLPATVTKLDQYAFAGCTGLTSVALPAGITTIGSYSFSDCVGITSFTFPTGLTTIGDGAFMGCTSLTAARLASTKTVTIGKSAFNGCKALSAITWTSSTTTIGDNAFQGCTSLVEINLTASAVQSIGAGAFAVCTNLEKVTFVTALKTLGAGAFSGCEKIKSVDFTGTSVAAIPDYLFSACSSLADVKLTSRVKSIGNSAFSHCASLKTINISDTTVTEIGNSAFEGCSVLAAVTFPATLTRIGEKAFDGIAITRITIDENVEIVDSKAFGNCASLTTVNMYSTIVAMTEDSFDGCTAITRTYFKGSQTQWNNLISHGGLPHVYFLVGKVDGDGKGHHHENEWKIVGSNAIVWAPSYLKTSIKRPATCTTEGETNNTCSFCGNTWVDTIPVLDHTVSGGTCTTCGRTVEEISSSNFATYFTNDASAMFTVDGSKISSSNTADGSSSVLTFTAETDCLVTVDVKNSGSVGSTWVVHSGSTTITIEHGATERCSFHLNGGQTITFTYTCGSTEAERGGGTIEKLVIAK